MSLSYLFITNGHIGIVVLLVSLPKLVIISHRFSKIVNSTDNCCDILHHFFFPKLSPKLYSQLVHGHTELIKWPSKHKMMCLLLTVDLA